MKYNLSALMSAAWRFVHEFGFTMSKALKQAWMQFKLRARMAKGVVKFFYMKANGSLREAYGTLKDVPATMGLRASSHACQTYYDVDVDDWRCYRLERLVRVC